MILQQGAQLNIWRIIDTLSCYNFVKSNHTEIYLVFWNVEYQKALNILFKKTLAILRFVRDKGVEKKK